MVDSIGSRIIVEPTLLSYGLKRCGFIDRSDFYIGDKIGDWLKPKQIVINFLTEKSKLIQDVEYIVYHTWKARDGHSEYIEVYYKKLVNAD